MCGVKVERALDPHSQDGGIWVWCTIASVFSGFNNINNFKINLSINFSYIIIIFILFDIELGTLEWWFCKRLWPGTVWDEGATLKKISGKMCHFEPVIQVILINFGHLQ